MSSRPHAGRDALGLGASIAHPRESDEWRGMSMQQRFEFFAPIWRVMVRGGGGVVDAPQIPAMMPQITARAAPSSEPLPPCIPPFLQRDSPMTVAEVREQVEYVALVTKQASSVSDLRHHTYLSPTGIKAPVVYFRAATQGACTYMNDARDAGEAAASQHSAHGSCPSACALLLLLLHDAGHCAVAVRAAVVPHGACWYDLCEDLEVIDVPGDHFSLLRQVRKQCWSRAASQCCQLPACLPALQTPSHGSSGCTCLDSSLPCCVCACRTRRT